MRAPDIDNAEGKQGLIVELYDKFFKTAFPKMVERLGIVYTPVEVVEFIIHSVNDVLKREFYLRLVKAALVHQSKSLVHQFKNLVHQFKILSTRVTHAIVTGAPRVYRVFLRSRSMKCVFRTILYHRSAANLTTYSGAKFTTIPDQTLPVIPLESLPDISFKDFWTKKSGGKLADIPA